MGLSPPIFFPSLFPISLACRRPEVCPQPSPPSFPPPPSPPARKHGGGVSVPEAGTFGVG